MGKRLFGSVAIISAAVLAQGCRTTTRVDDPDVRITDRVPVVAQAEQGRAAEAHVKWLNMAIQPQGGDAAGQSVAGLVASDLQSGLLAQGFTISEHAPDVAVGLAASVSEFDRSGNYYRHDGTLDARVSMPQTGREIGTRRFSQRGDRKLGEEESLRDLAAKLAQPAGEWLQSLTGPLGRELAVVDLRVTRRGRITLSSATARTEDAAYANLFVERVGKLDGVLACELVGQDYRARTMQFRIMHRREAFPAGLLNRLIEIEDLQLRP